MQESCSGAQSAATRVITEVRRVELESDRAQKPSEWMSGEQVRRSVCKKRPRCNEDTESKAESADGSRTRSPLRSAAEKPARNSGPTAHATSAGGGR